MQFKQNRKRIVNHRLYFAAVVLTIALSIPAVLFSQKSDIAIADSSSCNSYILISGKSSINHFNFIYDFGKLPQPISATGFEYDDLVELTIPVKDFVTNSPLLYEDFLLLMRASEYPAIRIEIPKYQLASLDKESYSLCPEMKITIAGITHHYKIDCSVVNCYENIFLVGKQKLRLSDFDLEIPGKLFGLVRVQDEINVFLVLFLHLLLTNN